ncbi:polymorphic toxin type 44 domain-containing protein [Mycolicibacterium fallax]|uniref:Bacterial toxin 44 domain-containing protein n=1 Tax=Mycolicibacterium fallax TaxID=1793 RepID=A0A1X1RJ24_MYCFA|nr:polymorphic toxin type 44 domain-containing protein [Mycolicibacterium fallax]ORV07538.1 hypothetical protein AWC04_03760 [Mycolicibacterium fallax]
MTLDQVMGANHEVVLAEIRSWTQTADDLDTAAEDYVRMVEHPGGTVWSGRTAEAAVTLAYSDRKVIGADADAITKMSTNAENAMVAPVAALGDVRAMIENARQLGFDVNQDLSVSWTRPTGMSDKQAEAYENAVAPFSQQIQAAGKAWWDAELVAAEKMITQANGLALPFDDAGNPGAVEERNGRIVLVDNDMSPGMDAEGGGGGGSWIAPSDRFAAAEEFIYNEMSTNVNSPWVSAMKKSMESMNPLEKADAIHAFYNLVKEGGPWDHKPQIRALVGAQNGDDLFFQEPGSDRQVFYDIYSNLHYGYIGRASGLPEWLLMEAAGGGLPGTGVNDPGDDITMKAGITLFEKYGPGMTAAQFHAGMMDAINELTAAQAAGSDITQIRIAGK